jgi:tetratricopeptide (TPR) repeat protein
MSRREDIIGKARRCAKEGDYEAAIQEYARLIERNPLDLEAKIKIAYLHACRRDREAAADVYLEVAHMYETADDLQNASKVLTQVLRLQPQRTDAYFWQADLLERLDRRAEARQWLEAAYRQLESRKRPGEALQALARMVELDPGNVALLIRLGEGLASAERGAEAIQTLRRAADVLRMAEWTDDFIRVAERLVYLDATDTALAKELATLYLRRRDPRRALRKLQRCYPLQPEDPETLNLIVEAFMDLRELDKAVTILEVLAALHERRGEWRRHQAARDRIGQLSPQRSAVHGAPDTEVSAPPLELLASEEPSPVPLTTDELQLHTLERSLQAGDEPGQSKPRFLPAITAQHPGGDRRHGAPGFGAGQGPVTLELEDADLVEVTAAGADVSRRTRRDAVTEVRPRSSSASAPARSGSSADPSADPTFRSVATVPDSTEPPPAEDTQVNPRGAGEDAACEPDDPER